VVKSAARHVRTGSGHSCLRAAKSALRRNERRTTTPTDDAAGLTKRALFYRARARRIRELATAVNHPDATAALRIYASELEQRAVELEAKAASLRQTKPEECD